MNSLEHRMVTLLREIANKYDAVALKAEFEAEGTRVDELKRLKDIAHTAGLGMVVKIGGPEAITDMFEARLIGATTIIAPMIESAYALTKYIAAIEKYFSADERADTKFGINIETVQGVKQLPAMLKLPNIHALSVLTVGRVDLSASLGLSRAQISSPRMNAIAEAVFRKAKTKGFITTVGGGVDQLTLPLIESMTRKKLLDRFETRKIVFATGARSMFVEEGILKANEFELLWLTNKRRYYNQIIGEDEKRITMLQKRVALLT